MVSAMTTARPRDPEAIFTGALERTTAGERAAFLDGACAGEAELRARVEALLGGIDLTQAQKGLSPQEATPAAARVRLAPIICPGLVVVTLAGWAGYRRIRQIRQ